MHRFGRSRLRLLGSLVLGALVATGIAPAAAQDDDAASPGAEIRAGSCDELGAEPLYALNGFTTGFFEEDDADEAAVERVGAESAVAMVSSTTELETTFADLLADPHAIVVGTEAEQPIACGEIGGYFADDAVLVGVRATEGADLAGVAFLWDDDDEVTVELHVAESLIALDG